MEQRLVPHPESRCESVAGLVAGVTRSHSGLVTLRYAVTGDIAALRMPLPTARARVDRLWEHTCFEAFLRVAPGDAYYEFNFAPSTQWAAYRFDGYRSGMVAARGIATPHIETRSNGERFDLLATVALGGLPDFRGEAVWHVGLAAVLEDSQGEKSYWALAHPPGKPDFHQSDCFVLEVTPA